MNTYNYINEDFENFLQPKTDRFFFLCNYLDKNNIHYSVINIKNRKHISINFPKTCYNPLFRIKIIAAHYDIVENSPGANDNSAAVFQLLELSKKLIEKPFTHNLKIILTDGEEAGSLEDQGAYSLAKILKEKGLTNTDVYTIDCCGRGDILVISQAGKNNSFSGKLKNELSTLFTNTAKLAQQISKEKWFILPVPYGDNAGFLAAGFPAIAITLLPKEEVNDYVLKLHQDKEFEKAVMTHGSTVKEEYDHMFFSEKLPMTWRMIHTELDSIGNLTNESFKIMENFLYTIANTKYLV